MKIFLLVMLLCSACYNRITAQIPQTDLYISRKDCYMIQGKEFLVFELINNKKRYRKSDTFTKSGFHFSNPLHKDTYAVYDSTHERVLLFSERKPKRPFRKFRKATIADYNTRERWLRLNEYFKS